ncbi:MAG: hypothetical protein JOZ52_04810 [Acidobacteria bacterium]|nr:hypothetical protein [Acidobacteriota bacterium]
MQGDWAAHETGTHQDHVIAHVVGATVLGYFTMGEAAHLLLDIGFIWAVYLDCEMGLVPQSMALAELELDEAERALFRQDARLLLDGSGDADSLKRFTPAPEGCLITEVLFQARGDERRLLITCEEAGLAIETSLATGEVRIYAV